MRRDDAECVESLLVIVLQLRGSNRLLELRRGIRDWGCLVLGTHVRSHLAEEVRRFDVQLHLYEYSPAIEHMHAA